MVKKLFQSRTLWTGLTTICTGLGMFFSGEQELQELLISVVGVIFIFLRLVTTGPVEI